MQKPTVIKETVVTQGAAVNANAAPLLRRAVMFLEDGKLMDFGTHAELCARCEGYRNLVHLQKLDEEGGNDHV